MPSALIIDAIRTPRGRGKPGKGALSAIHPQELLAQTLNELVRRTGATAADIEDVVVGCVSEVKEQGANLARNAVLAAGLPDVVTGVTLNRFCGSGLQACNFAALGVMSGQQDLVVGGGVESMSRVPMGSDEGMMDGLNLDLRRKIFQVPQGISADLIATLDGVGREELDRFALTSQERAAVAAKEGRFSKSLIPVLGADGKTLLDRDEHPRADTTLEGLAALGPAFARMGAMAVGAAGETLDQLALARYPEAKAIEHVHHAGNSSGIVDGAAAVLFAS
jgi:acetyl-CoA C-acetyltransferase